MLLPKLRVEKANEPFDPLAATDCAPPPLGPAAVIVPLLRPKVMFPGPLLEKITVPEV